MRIMNNISQRRESICGEDLDAGGKGYGYETVGRGEEYGGEDGPFGHAVVSGHRLAMTGQKVVFCDGRGCDPVG